MTTTTQLPRSYVPGEHEDAARGTWDRAGVFGAAPSAGGEPYCILIPPPNVTAALHLGHAFNNTLQDVLTRYHRMRGCNTLWMPGTDHAGIATQTVVEKRLLAQGTSRRALGRDAFVARVQEWKEEYEATITEQLRALGCSCDWSRQRFTMDPICTRAVRAAFFRLFADGLVYRGKRLVNWDPVTQTALADDEVEMKEVEGRFWYLRYPLVDERGRDTGEHVTVATTRPETMLGDTAVAVNPADRARARLIGRTVRLPIVNRLVPIIGDDYVVLPDPGSADPKARYASGFLKVTPAHDPSDWEIGRRHDLPVINVLAPDASISRDHGWPAEEFASGRAAEAEAIIGLSREDARRAVVEWFRTNGLLEGERPYAHSVGHSYRSHSAIEPYLSDQWYVRVTDDRLVGEAQRALAADQRESATAPRSGGAAHPDDGTMRFHPARYARTYEAWHDGLRDWCVSRQLWWGHRIPVWTFAAADAEAVRAAARRWSSRARAGELSVQLDEDAVPARVHACLGPDADALARALEADGFAQDEDVLDTWFSSALWPLSTMGWPEPARFPETLGLLETFVPTSVLCTARDIITLWVSRMVMFSRHLHGRVPFRDVYVHAMIQDGHGQRMSKSLGNGVDPRDCIVSHGADAVRFAMVQLATSTQDVRMPVDMTCPHCGETYAPASITSPAGFLVAAPRQRCPKCGGAALSGYGVASGAATPTTESPLARNTSSKFDLGRNFGNKLWNATRFALTVLETADPREADPALSREGLALVDRWMISRLHAALHAIEDALAAYQFSAYADAVYDLARRDFCDWYLEAIKPTVRGDARQRQVLRTVLDAIMRMLHPICPFVTETLWPSVRAMGRAGLDGVELAPAEVLAGAAWPDVACRVHDEGAVATFERARSLVEAIRNLRGENQVPTKRRITLHAPPPVQALVAASGELVPALAGLGAVAPAEPRPAQSIPFPFEGHQLDLSDFRDAIDADSERSRLDKLVREKAQIVEGYRRRLANEAYVRNAPAALVQETRDLLAEAEGDLAAARTALAALGGAA